MLYYNLLYHILNVCLCCMFQVEPDNARKVTKACLILHNIMRSRYPNQQNAELAVIEGQPGAWRAAGVMEEVEEEGRGPRTTREGKELRAYLKHYYNSAVGSVPWQEAALEGPLN